MNRIVDTVALLQGSNIILDDFAARFEAAGPAEQIAITEAIDRAGQERLWELAAGRTVRLDELVPPGFEPLHPVIFHGKNSLPAVSRFQKRFCRPPPGTPGCELWGFNFQPLRWLVPLTGPGYFVAYEVENQLGTIAIDYRRVPTARPADWPPIVDNSFRLSRFIYHGTVDYLRRISDHLLIGRATRGGTTELPNWFLLCREDVDG